MKTVRINDNLLQPSLAGMIGVVIRRRGPWVWVRIDNHPYPLDTDGKGWFLPKNKVQSCKSE